VRACLRPHVPVCRKTGDVESLAEIVRQIRLAQLELRNVRASALSPMPKIVNLVHDPLFRGSARQQSAQVPSKCDLGRAERPAAPENSIPRVFARPCISPTTQG